VTRTSKEQWIDWEEVPMALGCGGLKYDVGAGAMPVSSSRRNWPGLFAEHRKHYDGHLSSFVQEETEVAILIRGQGTVVRRSRGIFQTTHAKPGALWLCPRGVAVDFLQSSSDELEVVHLYIASEQFCDGDSFEELNLQYLGGFRDPLIEQIGRTIFAEMQAETSAGRLLVETLGRSLAAWLRHSYARSAPSSPPKLAMPGGLDRRRLMRVLDFIEANLEANLSIDDMASVAHLSPFHFARAFKASTGQAPHRYVSAKRLELAKSLLAKGERPVVEIATAVNFSSYASFAKAFRRAVGLTPGQYRQSFVPS
jgi:AraC family transcriptional regulator